MDEEARQYFGRIEQHFIERRGRPLLLSPGDVARVARWHADGVPLDAALEGIDVHFERLARRGRTTRRAVTLAYLEDDVLDAWAGVRRRRLGRRPSGEAVGVAAEPLATVDEHQRLVSALEAAAATLTARPGDAERALAPLVARAAGKLRAKRELFEVGGPSHDEQKAEDALRRLERALLDEARSSLGAALVTVERQAEADVADKRAKLGEAQFQRIHSRLVDKLLRDRFALPRLSLLYA